MSHVNADIFYFLPLKSIVSEFFCNTIHAIHAAAAAAAALFVPRRMERYPIALLYIML